MQLTLSWFESKWGKNTHTHTYTYIRKGRGKDPHTYVKAGGKTHTHVKAVLSLHGSVGLYK